MSPCLKGIKARLRRVDLDHSDDVHPDSDTIAVVLVDLDQRLALLRRHRRLLAELAVPVYLVVSDELSAAKVRALYADGAAGVIDWPREALVLSRFLAELLSLRLTHGRAPKPDSALRRAARARLRLLEQLHEQPRIEVHGGAVAVSGRVDSLPTKIAVEACIEAVPGVTRLDSSGLFVVPEPVSDAAIRAACKRIVRNSQPEIESAVSISVDSGIVTLGGRTKDRREINRIRNLATQLLGVRQVDVELTAGEREPGSDRRANNRLEGLLRDLVREDGLSVSYHSGIAVLSGTIRSLSKKRAAVHLLEDDPAIDRVIDKLVIKS